MTTCMKQRKFYKYKLVCIDATKRCGSWEGINNMVKKPKDGILGTDEGHLAYFKGLEEEGKSGKDRRLSKLPVCMYIHICRMHASLFNFKVFSRHSYLLDGPIYLLAILAILAIYDNRNCGCFEEWSLCGCMG